VRSSASCGGAGEEGGASGTINQALRSLQADVAQIRSLVAENATIISAKITNLSVEDIKAGRIRSMDFSASDLQMIYPDTTLYPGTTILPNRGEEIVRGIEIDFKAGVIRGVFFDSVTDAQQKEIDALKSANEALAQRVLALEQSLSSSASN